MDNASQGTGRKPSGNRNRNRNRNNNRNRNSNRDRNQGGNPRRSPNRKPRKKQNWFLALFAKWFGSDDKKKSRPSRSDSSRSESPRVEKSGNDEEKQPEVSSPRLYIGNLSYDTTESDLFDHFATVGQVKNAEVVRDRSDRSKGFGFVEMNSVEMAKTASEKFHRTDYMGRQIIVAGAKKQ